VRAGDGGLLVIEGPAGIGKTGLLDAVRAAARVGGPMAALSARGGELERDFPFGVVRQLFEPTLAGVPETEREEVLAGAAALAMPALEDSLEPAAWAASDASCATLHGLYWLSANLAARGPLLITVDDLHWADAPSLRFLAYLIRRLEGLPMLVALAARMTEPGTEAALLDEITTDPLAQRLRPSPLSPAGVERLLRGSLADDADSQFIEACHRASGGNPLLVRELVAALVAEGVAPTADQAAQVAELGPTTISRSVERRLERLPFGALELARAVAVLGDDTTLRDAAALAVLDEGVAERAAAALARVEILRPGLPLAFVHPVIRAAVRVHLAPGTNGHAEAARLLAGRGAGLDQVAAQLLASERRGEPWVVDTLRDAARRSLARGAPDVAATYLRRALEEPPPAEARGEVLLELGLAEARTDLGGLERMSDALALTSDPVGRAEIALARGRTLGLAGRHDEAVDVFEQAIAELAGADLELELRLEAEMVAHCLHSAAKLPLAFSRLERLPSRPPMSRAELLMRATAAFALTSAGRVDAVRAAELARATVAAVPLAEEENSALALFLPETLIFADQLEEAAGLLNAAIRDARQRGSLPGVALASAFGSQVALRRGDLRDAEADARTALELVDPRVLGYSRPYILSFLVDALVERGDYRSAESVLGEAGLSGDWPELWQFALLLASRGRLRLAQGRTAEGVADLLACGRRVTPWRPSNPGTVAWRSEAAIGLVRLGQRGEAARLAQWELRHARAFGARRPLGVALRATGLVAGGAAGLDQLREAVEVLDGSPAVLEHARALTDLGAVLRRKGERKAAREPLRKGLDLARRCGAAPLAGRAHEELVATGARPRRLELSGVDSLTASERRVAQLAASGLTNREVAQALFITEKTVEVHLSRTYRKLDIGSRSQLPGALHGDATAAPRLETAGH
jgi:DNA-binding CsgD family transcriptional regulator